MKYLFVEGSDDEKYFSKVFGETWKYMKFIQYSGWTKAKINNFIKSISCIPTSDYIFIGDADGKTIEQKTQDLISKYTHLKASKVAIVQYEIESWYYAGVNELMNKKIGMKRYIYNTDQLTKEAFTSNLSNKTDRKYIMSLILSLYEFEIAIKRNTSLSIFAKKIKKELA